MSLPRGVFECHPGTKCVSFMFFCWIPLISILGLWEWHLAHLEFEHFSSESTPGEGGINWVHWNLPRGTQQWYNVLNLCTQGSYCISIQPQCSIRNFKNLYLLCKWTKVEYRIGTILVLLWVTLMSALARDVVQDMQYRMQSAVCCMPYAIEYAAPCAWVIILEKE